MEDESNLEEKVNIEDLVLPSNSIEHGDTKDFSDCSTTMVKKEEALEPFLEDQELFQVDTYTSSFSTTTCEAALMTSK